MRAIAARLVASFALLLISMPFEALAACPMCSAYSGCYLHEGDGFEICSQNVCSGICRNRPPCWEPPCLMSPEVDPSDLKAGSCGTTLTIAKAFTSSRSAAQILATSNGDQLLAQAILQFEAVAKGGLLRTSGAFQFAVAGGPAEWNAVMAGQRLRIDPLRAASSGFADYVASLDGQGGLDISLRVWRVAFPESQPIEGLSANLRYALEGNTISLLQQSTWRVMPEIQPEYMAVRLPDVVVPPNRISDMLK